MALESHFAGGPPRVAKQSHWGAHLLLILIAAFGAVIVRRQGGPAAGHWLGIGAWALLLIASGVSAAVMLSPGRRSGYAIAGYGGVVLGAACELIAQLTVSGSLSTASAITGGGLFLVALIALVIGARSSKPYSQ